MSVKCRDCESSDSLGHLAEAQQLAMGILLEITCKYLIKPPIEWEMKDLI